MSQETSKRNALIVGGTSGIGRAIAMAMSEQEMNVKVTGLAREDVENFDSGGMAIVSETLDVTDAESIHAFIATFDQLDILVNCAGIILRDEQEFTPAGFSKVLEVNLSGTMRMCLESHELLARSQGCIINIASMLTFFGSRFAPAYSASKGGVAQLTKSLAIAWADDGIRVNAIAPGWINTALTSSLINDPQRSQTILERTPLKRWGKPADVAGAAIFLCSPGASFVTGVVLPVDGGYCIA